MVKVDIFSLIYELHLDLLLHRYFFFIVYLLLVLFFTPNGMMLDGCFISLLIASLKHLLQLEELANLKGS